jgi:hypothetical protein
MKTQLLLTVASAGLLLAVQPADAGSCTQQISELEKTLASKDAGMGPVARGTEPSPPQGGMEVPKAGEVPGTAATPAMTETLKGRAASPEDVLRQNQGQPTASEAAQAGRGAPVPQFSEAMASLQRARELDKAGKEAECMAAVQQARDQIPSR